MGRLVRRYIRTFDITIRNSMTLGTRASPIAQFSAGQITVSAFIDSGILGGDVIAGDFGVRTVITSTVNQRAVRIWTQIPTGVVVTGYSYGIHIEQEIVGTGQISGDWNSIQIEQWSNSGVAVGGGIRALHVVNTITTHPTGVYELARFSKHGAALCDQGITIECGAAGDMTYAFRFQGTPVAAWAPATAPGGARTGRIAVLCHGVPLYIPLWT